MGINLPHNLYGEKYQTSVCLFVKDSRSDFKDLNITGLPFKLKVIDIKKLKLKFSRFQERRTLLKQYELFLCDSKIYMLLKKLLGKPFYVARKYPVPMKLDYTKPEEIKSDIANHVEKNSTFYMSHGPNYSVKIARAVMSNEEVLDNVREGVTQTLSHILKWGVDFEE
jgi:ribosome biogenesis protein UTP30